MDRKPVTVHCQSDRMFKDVSDIVGETEKSNLKDYHESCLLAEHPLVPAYGIRCFLLQRFSARILPWLTKPNNSHSEGLFSFVRPKPPSVRPRISCFYYSRLCPLMASLTFHYRQGSPAVHLQQGR